MDNNTIDTIIAKHQSENGALISILHDIQGKQGHISEDIMYYLSNKLKLPLSEVFRVITYYDRVFNIRPQQKHTVRVCQGTACHLKHADQLLTEITEEFGEDGKIPDFHIEQVRCLGCCNTAPAVEVNGEILDKDSAKETITKLRGEK